jgi:serine protease AprX
LVKGSRVLAEWSVRSDRWWRRGALAALVLAGALVGLPGGAAADDGTPAPFMPASLATDAATSPDQLFRVIIQGRPAVTTAGVASAVSQDQQAAPSYADGVDIAYSSINAVSAEVTGEQLLLLKDRPDILAITPDAPLRSVVGAPPLALEPPVVTGVAQAGAELSATSGQWSGLEPIALAYQWQRCDAIGVACADITGASAATYVATADDVGSTLAVEVTATNDDGTGKSASAPTGVVAAAAPVVQIAPPSSVVAPLVGGTAVTGATLTASDGLWGSAGVITLARQWQRCTPAGDGCADIDGALGRTYVPADADIGSTLRVVVTASDVYGSTSAPSAVTTTVVAGDPVAPPPPPPPSPTPTIVGTAQEGVQLQAVDGTSYQWQRCDATGAACADIAGAVAPTYVVAPGDVGATLRVLDGATASVPTAVVLPMAPQNLTAPGISGRVVLAKTLRAGTGTWGNSTPLTFSFQWRRCDAAGTSCTDIPDAVDAAYAPGTPDIGSTLQAEVTAENAAGSVVVRSLPTKRVPPSSESGFWNWQLGPYAAGLDGQWTAVANAAATPPAIAIVDSGVDSSLPGLAGAVVQQQTLTSLQQSAGADSYGHGSFVAAVAAGRAPGEAGAAPTAPVVSLDVMNDDGMALTSDVVAAADWIYTHKAESNIKVANFSLVGSTPSTVQYDPLDRALERLWLSGIVVVTAAGNYGNGTAGDVAFAPANDPFVITVGASDVAGTISPSDDFAAPWSVFGHTYDGFAKPELAAPGRYVEARVPTDSTLYRTRPDRIVSPGVLQLSGTSFAAPLVAGVAANLLALHPAWTPDQVKGALMLTAVPAGAATEFSVGVGEVDAAAATAVADPPNPNADLDSFVTTDPASGDRVFDTASWGTAVQANASWGTASWGTASWGTASWGTASWGTAFWSSASWGTASWGTASWGTASWGTDFANDDAGASYPMLWSP